MLGSGASWSFFFFLSKYFVSCYAKQQEPMFVDDFQNNYYTKKIVLWCLVCFWDWLKVIMFECCVYFVSRFKLLTNLINSNSYWQKKRFELVFDFVQKDYFYGGLFHYFCIFIFNWKQQVWNKISICKAILVGSSLWCLWLGLQYWWKKQLRWWSCWIGQPFIGGWWLAAIEFGLVMVVDGRKWR